VLVTDEKDEVPEDIAHLHLRSLAPERGNVLGGNDLETQEWRFCETLSDREGRNEGVTGSKSRTSVALARRVCRSAYPGLL